MSRHVFLTAEWRHLAMLNYEVDPAVLRAFVPDGTELDLWDGKAFVSVVAFQFLDTRVMGVAVPFHRNFEEINLRFYVRRRVENEWRRAVVFIKEIVPRFAIAITARVIYGENYVALPTVHRLGFDADGKGLRAAHYGWRINGTDCKLDVGVAGDAQEIRAGSAEEFITEHYWGYARGRDGRTREYKVEHPRWRVWRATEARLECDVATLYGPEFVHALQSPPASAFVADGSPVKVFKGRLIPTEVLRG